MKSKRFFSLLLCLCIVMSLFTGIVSTASADDGVITYTVQNGDYLFKVCKRLGLDYYQCKSAIMALNGFTSDLQLNKLSVGQTIKLPSSNAVAATVTSSTTTTTAVSTTTTVNGATTTTTTYTTSAGTALASGTSSYNVTHYLVPYTVQYGDTLNSICNAHGVSYAVYSSEIMAVNGIKSANSLWAGKTIYVPSATASGNSYAVVAHTVTSGQTVTSILNSYGSSVGATSTLMTGLNSSVNLNKIYAGQTIYVPVLASAATSSASAVTTTTSTAAVTATAAPATTYEISFTNINTSVGTPYATVNGSNVSSAAAGSLVVVGSKDSTGHAIKSLTVYTNNGMTYTTYQGNSFTMPAQAVRVQANYEEAYPVIKSPTTNGTFQILVNDVEGTYALPGDTIKIVPNPNTGYILKSEPTTDPDQGTLKHNDARTWYSFTMPAKSVTVTCKFDNLPTYALTWTTESGVVKGTFTVQANGLTLTSGCKIAAGTLVTVNCSPTSGNCIRAASTTPSSSINWNGNTLTFAMPSGNTTLSIVFGNGTVYSLNVKSNSGGGSATFLVEGNAQNVALAGQTVKIIPVADTGYQFDHDFVRYAGTNAAVMMSSADTFVMPDSSVDVYCEFNAIDAYYTVSQSSESGCGFTVASSPSNLSEYQRLAYKAGETVYITPSYDHSAWQLPANNVFWRVAGTETWNLATLVSGDTYSFTMPSANVEIKANLATYENWVYVTLNPRYDGANVVTSLTATVNGETVTSGNKVKNGSVITLTAVVADGYEFAGFAVNSGAKNGLANLTQPSANTYTCTYTVAWNDGDLTFDIRTP